MSGSRRGPARMSSRPAIYGVGTPLRTLGEGRVSARQGRAGAKAALVDATSSVGV